MESLLCTRDVLGPFRAQLHFVTNSPVSWVLFPCLRAGEERKAQSDHPIVLSVTTMIGHSHEPADSSFSCGVSKQARKAEVTPGTLTKVTGHRASGPALSTHRELLE